jgi:hypothetical protein
MSITSKWVIFTIAALVIIGSSSFFGARDYASDSPPVLTITGSNAVRDGGVLQIHGQGFHPGDGIT